jgi:L-rhamnose-H+ transport protein
MSNTGFGILLLLVAGAMNGSFTLPMKFTTKWAWENTWLVWTIFALGLFPVLLAYLTVPFLGDVYAQGGLRPIAIAAGCGAGWGIAQVFFGLAVDAVGIALAFSLILGISAAVGALLPLCLGSGPPPFSAKGLIIIAGVALVLVGVLICARAGRAREAALRQSPTEKPQRLPRGLVLCTLSGLGAAMVALGFQYGSDLSRIAERHGAGPVWSNNATWLPVMWGGAIPNVVYCLYLLSKNKTRDRFRLSGTGKYWLLAAIMALFWFGSTVMYGISNNSLGIAVAWPTFMSLIVITAMVCGVLTGEWKRSGSKPFQVMYSGLAILVLSIVVLSFAKS